MFCTPPASRVLNVTNPEDLNGCRWILTKWNFTLQAMETDMQAAFSAGERRWESPYGPQTDLTVLVTKETGWRHSLLNNWWAGVALQYLFEFIAGFSLSLDLSTQPEQGRPLVAEMQGRRRLQRSTKLFGKEKWSCFYEGSFLIPIWFRVSQFL